MSPLFEMSLIIAFSVTVSHTYSVIHGIPVTVDAEITHTHAHTHTEEAKESRL